MAQPSRILLPVNFPHPCRNVTCSLPIAFPLLSPLSSLLPLFFLSSLCSFLLLSSPLLPFPFASLLPFPQQASKRLWIAKGYGGPWDPTFFVRKGWNPKSSPLSRKVPVKSIEREKVSIEKSPRKVPVKRKSLHRERKSLHREESP